MLGVVFMTYCFFFFLNYLSVEGLERKDNGFGFLSKFFRRGFVCVNKVENEAQKQKISGACFF